MNGDKPGDRAGQRSGEPLLGTDEHYPGEKYQFKALLCPADMTKLYTFRIGVGVLFCFHICRIGVIVLCCTHIQDKKWSSSSSSTILCPYNRT
ncbi:hypothetical protein GDO81_022594 [Engystomops pustulosus]|uniref:Uncharacterized protein n=1 Tax=Engystomops pustulosus TaxID=76066 RepID=A0AAV6YM21_ENGPU|nr:hypothetical protein GDO81_022594 [Engystomops pustulosus]